VKEAQKAPGKTPNRTKTMKRNLFVIVAAGAIAFGGFAVAQAEDGPGGKGGWHRHGNPLEHMTETLKLTPDQQTKVQPILDQAKPQIVAIHQEAMQKTKAVMDKTMSQIRPLLTPEQQQKLDAMHKAHEDMRNARKELHDARKE
jgi:Spy/CpxP family protein refolding chaperone